MFGNLIQRTIFVELVRVFLLSLVGITGILVMAGVVAEASQQGLSPTQILAAIPLLIPSTLPYTIPATTLFATCVVYGRLAHDNEILAIKAAGVNILVVVRPAVALGLGMSIATMALYYRLIPYTHFLLRTQFLNEVEESLYAMLKKDHCIKQPGLNYSMWVRDVQGKRLQEAIFKRRDPRTQHYDVIARAREAELKFVATPPDGNSAKGINPHGAKAKGRTDAPDAVRGYIAVHMRHVQLFTEKGDSAGYLHERIWEVPLPPDFGAVKNPKPRAMSYPELIAMRQQKREQVEAKAAEIALLMTRSAIATPPVDPRHIENLKTARRQYMQEIYSLEHEIQLRPALSFGCLCFVLIGCPVGIWLSRSDYLSAFISCFLPIVFIYYPLVLCGTNLSKQGRLPAEIAMWAPDALMALCALGLFRRLLKN